MLYIITGEDTATSRKKLSELLEGFVDTVRLDGKKSSVIEVEMALKSNGLFSDKKSVVIESFSKIKPFEALVEHSLGFVKDLNTNVILWDEVELSTKQKNAFKGIVAFSYTFPKVYFSFMDGLVPSSSSASLVTLREVLKSYEPEQILYSIIKRIRQLLILKSDNYREFEEFAHMQEWQLAKLRSQASKWSEEELKSAFLKYSELDEKIKTSGLVMPLTHHLDIILVQDLN